LQILKNTIHPKGALLPCCVKPGDRQSKQYYEGGSPLNTFAPGVGLPISLRAMLI
jgi:hypothetical protein